MPDQKKVISLGLNRDLLDAHTERRKASGEDCQRKSTNNLEPLAEVQGALLVVEVLHAPHPELGGLLLVGGEHFTAHIPNNPSEPAHNHHFTPTTDKPPRVFLHRRRTSS